MKRTKTIISLLIMILISLCLSSQNTIQVEADDYNPVCTITPVGMNYEGKNYIENTTVDVASRSVVQIDYFALQSGWMVFGLDTFTPSGTGTEVVYKTQLEGNYKAVLDFDSRIIYFRRVYSTPHTHNMVWGQIVMPTYNRPTVDTYFCTECYYLGATRDASVATYNSIYKPNVVNASTIKAQLSKVTPGTTVTINLGNINNIAATDMELIKASNATITLQYTSAGKKYVVTIPAGGCITFPSIEFYGPEFIRVAYNGTVQ